MLESFRMQSHFQTGRLWVLQAALRAHVSRLPWYPYPHVAHQILSKYKIYNVKSPNYHEDLNAFIKTSSLIKRCNPFNLIHQCYKLPPPNSSTKRRKKSSEEWKTLTTSIWALGNWPTSLETCSMYLKTLQIIVLFPYMGRLRRACMLIHSNPSNITLVATKVHMIVRRYVRYKSHQRIRLQREKSSEEWNTLTKSIWVLGNWPTSLETCSMYLKISQI
jgi:hypothetical protein